MSCAELLPVLELEIDCALASSNVFNRGVSDVIIRLRAERERLRKESQDLTATDGRTEKIEWISVDDELPDAGLSLLLFGPSHDPWVGSYDDDGGFWRHANDSHCKWPVTHWAELPNGPE